MKNSSRREILIPCLIIALPFLFYSYKLVPVDIEYFKIGSVIISNGGHKNLAAFIWNINVKLFIISLLLLWFISCKHWWRNIILVPLIIELTKLWWIALGNSRFFDEIEYIQSLPLTVPIVLVVILISRKLNFYSKNQQLKSDVNFEIQETFKAISKPNENFAQVRLDFEVLKRVKKNTSQTEYLSKLIEMRKRLYNN